MSVRQPNDRPRKYALPGWTLKLFAGLAKLKYLRATPFDLFGYTQERKIERALIDHYVETIEQLMAALDRDNLPIAIEIAELPQAIRGFGPVKMQSIEKASVREQELLDRFIRRGASPDIFYRAA